MWVPVLLFVMLITLFFIVIFKLIAMIPKANKIAASIFALLLTGVLTYVWSHNAASNFFTPMP